MQKLRGYLRYVEYARWDFKQSYLLALLPIGLIMGTFVAFLALYHSPQETARVQALPLLQALSVMVLPIGASLWGFLISSEIFEKASDIFRIKDRHFLFKTTVAVAGMYAILLAFASTLSARFAYDLSDEIVFLSLQALCASLVYLFLIALFSFRFETAFVGLCVSLLLILISYAYTQGWIQMPLALADMFDRLGALGQSGILLLLAFGCGLILYRIERFS